MEKVLYVSDLDGTLLRSDERVSDYSCSVINRLMENGMVFSYATARSPVTSGRVTGGLAVERPVIVYNGALTVDRRSGEVLSSSFFKEEEKTELRELLERHQIHPIVYSRRNGEESFSYLSGRTTPGMDHFLSSRWDDIPRASVEDPEELYRGETFYFICIDGPERLRPVWESLRQRRCCNNVYQRDIYSGEQWLELLPPGATKAKAALRLKERLHCQRIVAFGDGMNDLPLFEIADECYAMENAVPELKAVATGIIESNDRDGVAKWLCENVK